MEIAEIVEQVQVLWPYLDFFERYEWARRVAHIKLGDANRWVEVVAELAKRDQIDERDHHDDQDREHH